MRQTFWLTSSVSWPLRRESVLNTSPAGTCSMVTPSTVPVPNPSTRRSC